MGDGCSCSGVVSGIVSPPPYCLLDLVLLLPARWLLFWCCRHGVTALDINVFVALLCRHSGVGGLSLSAGLFPPLVPLSYSYVPGFVLRLSFFPGSLSAMCHGPQ